MVRAIRSLNPRKTLSDKMDDWDPGAYDRFRELRLIPALDLLAAIGPLPQGDVIDLGCGTGAVARALVSRFRAGGSRSLIGVDASPAMLEKARALRLYDQLQKTGLDSWVPKDPPALIYSNAALHWVPDHARLLPRLVDMLAPGGWLAVQIPGQNDAPSHAAWRALTGATGESGIETPERYAGILSPLGAARVWETRYYQELSPRDKGHPVRAFTASTYGRPFLDAAADRAALENAYDARMAKAYPLRPDGSVLFPFRRVFFVLQKH